MSFTESLNKKYENLSPQDRLKLLFDSFPKKEILFTSSFGTSSAVLLHMLSKVNPGHPVHFADTGYHFEETKNYRDLLAKEFGLNVLDVSAKKNRFNFTKTNKTYQLNHDLCCFINKVQPVDDLKTAHSIWISGLLQYQNANRQNLNVFEKKPDIIKFHPILDMTREEVELYIYLHDLPSHPLIEKGYASVGCTHCTKQGSQREGRWSGSKKIECGLHV